MKYLHSKIRMRDLIIALLWMIGALLFLNRAQHKKPKPCYPQQMAAAKRMQECINTLRSASLSKAPDIRLDPNRTNLIGEEYSPITTTLGDLIAKRASTNPDFAALLVDWMYPLNLQSGDVVAIGGSGSFPALIFATLSAAEILRLKPILIVSLGASSYGANRPEFTYLDMENLLFQKGAIHHRALAVSLGGAKDIAFDLTPEGRESLQQAILQNKVQCIYENDLERNIQQRAQIYDSPRVFVNIGGAEINIGNYEAARKLKPGLNRYPASLSSKPRSMAEYFMQQQIPIIHLLDVKRIALSHDLPLDPHPFLKSGTSAVYFETTLSTIYLLLSMGALGCGVMWLFWSRRHNSSS